MPIDTAPRTGPLSGVRVVDLSRVVAGPFGTQLLADLGARVLRVDPEGAGFRLAEPGQPLTGAEVFEWALNRDKATIELDLRSDPGRERLLGLLAEADVLYDNFRPGVMARLRLGPADLAPDFPHLVTCSVSGFGAGGPWAAMPAYDPVVQAAAGAMDVTGGAEPGDPPCRWGLPIGDLAAGMYGAIGVLAALAERRGSGRGQHVDVAMLDCQLALACYRIPQALDAGVDVRVDQHRGGAGSVPYGPFRGADGAWLVLGVGQPHWAAYCRVTGLDMLADDPRFATEAARKEHAAELQAIVEARLAERPAAEWEEALLAAGVPCGRALDLASAFTHPQVRARGMIATVTDGAGRTAHVARDPLHLSPGPRRAPDPADAGFRWPGTWRTPPAPGTGGTTAPLAGMRVVELDGEEPSKATMTQILADLGAEVVYVGRPQRVRDLEAGTPQVSPSEALRWGLLRGKRGLVLDLKDGADRQRLAALVAGADVVVDNYRPGVLARLGFDPAAIAAARTGFTWLSVTGFGHTGPWADRPAYDVTIQALGGAMSITGNGPGQMPLRWGHPIGGLAGALFGALGILARHVGEPDGPGRWIDLALLDCQVALHTYRVPQALDLQWAFGPQPHEGGNGARPYGAYPTGDGRFFVVAVTSQFWEPFCAAVGHPALAGDPRFATEALRAGNADALDAEVSRIFAGHDVAHWEAVFLQAGVPGSPVRTLAEAAAAAAGMIAAIPLPAGGEVHVARFPVRMSRSPLGAYTPAPDPAGGDLPW